MSDGSNQNAEIAKPLTPWEQRKSAVIRDTSLTMSEGEWDALRWHFAQAWTEGFEDDGPARDPGYARRANP